MRHDWTKTGEQYISTPEMRQHVLHAISKIDCATEPTAGEFDFWLPLPKPGEPPLKIAMMQGMGLQGAIKGFKLPGVTHIAVSTWGAPYGLLGIKACYEHGTQPVDIWLIDDGCAVTPILCKVYAKIQTVAA